MIEYVHEKVDDVVNEITPILEEHWEEVAVNKEVIKLNPDFNAYRTLETAGNLALFTARDEGVLVGYFVVIANYNPHYKDHIFAINDVIYLKPEYRGTMVGSELISYAEKRLKEAGTSVLVINTKTHIPFDSVLSRLGYTHVENTYSKVLKEEI